MPDGEADFACFCMLSDTCLHAESVQTCAGDYCLLDNQPTVATSTHDACLLA